MRVSSIFACAAALMSGVAQAQPVTAETRVSPALELAARELAARAEDIQCPGPFPSAPTDAFGQAVNELRRRGGQPSVGTYTCSDMCFAGGALVSFCNLNRNHGRTLESYGRIADWIERMFADGRCNRNGLFSGAIFPENQEWYIFAGRC